MVTYTVHLPKIKDVRTKALTADDFRGIAISPTASKIFELCILDRSRVFLGTTVNQFGFKEGTGCSQAIYTIKLINRCITPNLLSTL
jgi:hypothetical protein